jgi:hypothetical protein
VRPWPRPRPEPQTQPLTDEGLQALDQIMAERDYNPWMEQATCVGCYIGATRHTPCTAQTTPDNEPYYDNQDQVPHQGLSPTVANRPRTEADPGPAAPDRTAKSTAEDSGISDSSPNGAGRDDTATHQVVEESESDKRRERYWADLTRDRPTDEWEPT